MPKSLSRLRQKLGRKAKQEPSFRFYSLYGHLLREDVLQTAYRLCRANKGCAGVDRVTFDDIEAKEDGVQAFLQDILESLETRTYKPQPVLRATIPKANGDKRLLGIPTIRDRTVQVAARLVLEPIFEADFEDCSYGFRPARNQRLALEQVRKELIAGRTEVYDVDLSSYFDTIDHDRLMECIERRVSDSSMLKLIRMWLKSPVVEDDEGNGGRKIHPPTAGSPQGGSISPLLSNIYLHEMERAFHGTQGPHRFAGARIVRYADDMLVMAKWMGPKIVRWLERQLEWKLKLTINREKTSIVKVHEPGTVLNFLSFSFRFDRDLKGRAGRYLNVFPAKKAVGRIRDRVRQLTRRGYKKPLVTVVKEVNEGCA